MLTDPDVIRVLLGRLAAARRLGRYLVDSERELLRQRAERRA